MIKSGCRIHKNIDLREYGTIYLMSSLRNHFDSFFFSCTQWTHFHNSVVLNTAHAFSTFRKPYTVDTNWPTVTRLRLMVNKMIFWKMNSFHDCDCHRHRWLQSTKASKNCMLQCTMYVYVQHCICIGCTLFHYNNATILLGVACRRLVYSECTFCLFSVPVHTCVLELGWCSIFLYTLSFHLNIEKTHNHNNVACHYLNSLVRKDITRINVYVIIAMISYVLWNRNGNNFQQQHITSCV